VKPETIHLAAAAAGAGGGHVWLVIILAVVIYGIGYRISIRLHPYRRCRRCGESGKHRGAMFSRSFRACRRCGGAGRELRRFAREP
jgi:DnaJ-class molecular chaperone